MTVQARFERKGLVAIEPKAWGAELEPRATSGTADRGYTEEGDAAVVDIRGPLLRRAEGLLSLFCDDYESIGARARAAFESGASRVILRIDSPGGDAPGCFELSRELRAMSEASGKPLVAYADGSMCCSAAYAIACAATAGIVIAPTCYAGSIGVFEAMADRTAQSKALGLRIVVVSSGPQKTDRNPDVPISEEAVARVQAQVDQFAELFFQLVEELRGVPADDVRAMGGGVFLGEAAVGVGLADRISAWSDLIAGDGDEAETSMPSTKASKYDEALGAMRRAAEGDDDDAKKAKKALKAWENDGDEGKDPEKKDGEKSKSKADDGDGDGDDESKAKAEEKDGGDGEKEEGKSKARASVDVRSIARAEARAVVERSERAQAEALERTELFSKRPDWDVKMRATLSKLPIEELRTAVKDWAVRSGPMAPAAAASAMPTVQGATQGDLNLEVDAETEGRLNKLMGTNGKNAPSQAMVYGTFDRDLAQSHLAKIASNKETR